MRQIITLLVLLAPGCEHQPSANSEPVAEPKENLTIGSDNPLQDSEEAREQSPSAVIEPTTELQEVTVNGMLLKPTSVLNGKLSMLVPDGFSEMSQDIMKIKYPNERRPTLVYTNERGTVNFALDHKTTRISISDLPKMLESVQDVFRTMYPTAHWYSQGMVRINNRDWLKLDVQTPAVDTNIRNIIVATSLENRQLLVTFNTTVELEEEWLERGQAVINSLRINK